jgi:hypothetical protein
MEQYSGNSSLSKKIFKIKNKITRIMTGTAPRISCKPLLRALDILTMPSQYILPSMIFW